MTRRVHCRIPDRMDGWLEDLVDAGLFMNRSDVAREGVRRLVQEPRQIEDVSGSVNDERLTVRYPDILAAEIFGFVERGEAGSYGAVIRRGIVVIVDEYHPEARGSELEKRRYFA